MKIDKNQSVLASLLGSTVSGVFEIGLFHPLDTTAKRLMNNKTNVTFSNLKQTVLREHHKKGYGTQLLKYRLNQIKKYHSDIEICLDTSQHTYLFFEKFDFKIDSILKNGYGEGLDKYDMVLRPFE